MQIPLGQTHPGGCYLFFNAEITTKSMEQLLHLVMDGIHQQFTKITLCISSVGGDADSAVYALNTLSSLPVKVNTHNVDGVQSAAVPLFLAGARRTANPGSYFFFHQSSCNVDRARLTAPYLSERVRIAKRHDKRAAEIIADKTGRPLKSVYEWQRAELYMDAARALAEKLIDGEAPLAIPQNAYVAHVLV